MAVKKLYGKLQRALMTGKRVPLHTIRQAIRGTKLRLVRDGNLVRLTGPQEETLAHLRPDGRVVWVAPATDWLEDGGQAWGEWMEAEPPEVQLLEERWRYDEEY